MSIEKFGGPFNNLEEKKKKTNENKRGFVKRAFDSAVKNVRNSKILGVAVGVTALTAGLPKNTFAQPEQELINPKNSNKTYVLQGTKVFEKKVTRGGKREVKVYKGEAKNFGIKEEKFEDEKQNTQIPYDVNFHNKIPKDPKHTGSTTGSGETFRAEIPYKDGIRLFKGVEGEQQYKEWLSKFEKSGGKVGKLDLNNSESKNSSNQEEIAEKKSSDSSFYQEVKTREGTRVFRGEDGKREYQKWQQKLNNSRR